MYAIFLETSTLYVVHTLFSHLNSRCAGRSFEHPFKHFIWHDFSEVKLINAPRILTESMSYRNAAKLINCSKFGWRFASLCASERVRVCVCVYVCLRAIKWINVCNNCQLFDVICAVILEGFIEKLNWTFFVFDAFCQNLNGKKTRICWFSLKKLKQLESKQK